MVPPLRTLRDVLKHPRRRTLFEVLLAVAFALAIVIGVTLGLALAGSRNYRPHGPVRRAPARAAHARAGRARPARSPSSSATRSASWSRSTRCPDTSSTPRSPARTRASTATTASASGVSPGRSGRRLTGQYKSGGSTITQQLAGRLYADRSDISIRRKLVELWYSHPDGAAVHQGRDPRDVPERDGLRPQHPGRGRGSRVLLPQAGEGPDRGRVGDARHPARPARPVLADQEPQEREESSSGTSSTRWSELGYVRQGRRGRLVRPVLGELGPHPAQLHGVLRPCGQGSLLQRVHPRPARRAARRLVRLPARRAGRAHDPRPRLPGASPTRSWSRASRT